MNLDQPVTVMPPDGPVQCGRIRNLSRGGAFIVDLGQLPPVSAQVHLAFALPRGPEVEADATVLRSVSPNDPEEPEGIAVQFNDEDPGALGAFVRDTLEPGGNKVRLRLETHGAVITARARHEEDGVLTLECDLPFLCIGSNVHLQRTWEGAPVQTGVLSWVSAQAPPGSAYPRIHLGISLGTAHGDPTPDRLPLAPPRHTGRQDPTNLVSTAPPMPPPLVQPRRRRQRWWLAAGLGALLGVALVASAAWLHDNAPRPLASDVQQPRRLILPAPTPVRAVPLAAEAIPEMLPRWWPPTALVSEAVASAAPARAHAPRRRLRSRTLSWGRRTRAVRRHLAIARRALQQNRPAVARRHALKALSLDPANEQAESLVAKARKDIPDS